MVSKITCELIYEPDKFMNHLLDQGNFYDLTFIRFSNINVGTIVLSAMRYIRPVPKV